MSVGVTSMFVPAETPVILFIDELHNMVGAGNASGSMDAANVFKPALSRGDIQIIGTTTLDDFREYYEHIEFSMFKKYLYLVYGT